MKILIVIITAVFFMGITATGQDTMYIHQNGGMITKIAVNKIDSVIFYQSANPMVFDIDGNGYNIITIGTQTWLRENLRVTRLNDGTTIPLVTDIAAWSHLSTPGFCWYNNDASTYKETYGALYNWYTANTGKLCPTGWHVPNDAEWTTLTAFLGGLEGSGGKMKETGTAHWNSPNEGATNSSGFTALGAGFCDDTGVFGGIREKAFWWTATETSATYARFRSMNCNTANVNSGTYSRMFGYSMRCLRN
jgi:uncharacterized protein (TIGR02145 family)